MNIDDPKIVILTEYADLDESEWGEVVTQLLQLHQSRSLFSNKFVIALEKELLNFHKDIGVGCTIVEREKTHKVMIRKLEWK